MPEPSTLMILNSSSCEYSLGYSIYIVYDTEASVYINKTKDIKKNVP